MISREEIVKIGKFQKTHALKGELNMISDIDPEYFMNGNPLIVETDGIYVPYYADNVRPKGSTSYLIKLSGIDSEDEASEFVNREINILKKDAMEWLPEDVIDSEELIGYKIVETSTGKILGEISDIDDSTANVLFYVMNEAGEEIFIPANDDLIEEIDDEARHIIMRIPDGLLDL